MAFGACAAYELHRRLRQAAVCTKDRFSRRREKSPRARQEHMSRPPAAPLSLAPNQVGCIEPRPLSVRDVWCDALRRIVRPGTSLGKTLAGRSRRKRCRSQSTRRTVIEPCASSASGTWRSSAGKKAGPKPDRASGNRLNSRVKRTYSTRCGLILYGFAASVASTLWRKQAREPHKPTRTCAKPSNMS